MERELGDIGTHFRFENAHVKVWDLILEPGESSPWHRHPMHYLFVVTEPGTLLAEYSDGTSTEHQYELGQVVMGEKGSVHKVTNVGNARWSNAIVEVKLQD